MSYVNQYPSDKPVAVLMKIAAAAPKHMSYFNKIITLLWTWQQRTSERHELRRMSDHTLKDIGLSRADIVGEANKPFWRS